MPQTAGRTDPVKKNAKTFEVSRNIFLGSLARAFAARSAPNRRENGSREKNAKTLEASRKIVMGSLAQVWGHFRQEVPHTAGRMDLVKKNAETLEVSHKIFLGSLARVWGHLRQEVPHTAGRSRNGHNPDFCADRVPNRQGVKKFGGPFAPPARHTGKVLRNTGILLRRLRAEQARCWKIRGSFCADRAPNRQGVGKYGGPFAPPARRTGKVLENTRVLLRRPRAEQARCWKIRRSFCAAGAPNRQGVGKYEGPFAPTARRTGKVLKNTGVFLRRPRAEQARC